jgi:hypothetical protein
VDLAILQEADYVLTPCGRPVPPDGFAFVDLPRVIPFFFNTTMGTPGTPFNRGVANTSNTVFLCRGIVLDSGFRVRLKWPTGRFLSQSMEFSFGEEASPMSTGGQMLALTEEMPLDPDARVSVQLSGINFTGNANLSLWGVLRYMLKDKDTVKGGGPGSAAASCIVGYADVVQQSYKDLDMMADPIAELKERPRYLCGPNQNIMAPEWALGNQCTPETPEGFTDEPFTFFSPEIAIAKAAEVYGIPVIVPGAGEDVIIRKLRFFTTYTEDYFSIPVLAIRLPNGYSMMGGDMIPVAYDFAAIPNVFEIPVFPTCRIPAGQRLILDAADMLPSGGEGTATLRVQFDGVKRRRSL